jgi:predicted amidohydrolase YtcJ
MDNASSNTVFVGGLVRVDENTTAEAIVIREGRVVSVGDRETLLSEYPGAKEVNATGCVVAPGLIDTHPHMMHLALMAEPLVDIRKAKSWKEIIDAIRERAKKTPSGEWIMATPVGDDEHYFVKHSWRDLTEGTLPDAMALDSATSDHPVIIQAWAPRLPNVIALNTAGIQRLGLDGELPDSEGSITLEKNSAGNLTGRVMGAVTNYYNTLNVAWTEIWNRIPFIQPKLLPGALQNAMTCQNALGVTTVYEGHAMNNQQIGFYKFLSETGKLTVRVLAAPDLYDTAFSSPQVPDDAQLLKDVAEVAKIQGNFGDMFKVDGLCVSPTGPGFAGHMIMKEPYKGPFGGMVNGKWSIPPTLVKKVMRLSKERGLRLNICGGGWGENDTLLDILDQLRDEGVLDGNERWILQHGFFMDQSQAERYAAHGVQATVCPGFTYGKGDMYAERMGDSVLQHLGAYRRMIDAGMDVAGSSDWGPKNPFRIMALAVTHEMGKGERHNDGPAQVITQREAYGMWGRQASKVLGWQGIGDLHPGSHADLVLLDRDPVTCLIEDLAGTQIKATLLSGRLVWGNFPVNN